MSRFSFISRRVRWHWAALAIAMAAAPFWGCAGNSYGRVQADPAVTQMFKANSAPASFHYYEIGRPDLPYAIIGLKPEYQLANANQWNAIPYPELAHKSRSLWIPHTLGALIAPEGAWIVDGQRNRIGIWYSMYPNTSIEVRPDNTVTIFTPHLPTRED